MRGFAGFGGARESMGQDVTTTTNITFMEACHGVQKNVSYSSIKACKPCSGSGAKQGSSPKTCPQCRGSGQVILIANLR